MRLSLLIALALTASACANMEKSESSPGAPLAVPAESAAKSAEKSITFLSAVKTKFTDAENGVRWSEAERDHKVAAHENEIWALANLNIYTECASRDRMPLVLGDIYKGTYSSTVKFACVEYFTGLGELTKMETVSKEMVHVFTKDFKGGILVKEANPKSKLKEGDVITHIEGKRVQTPVELATTKVGKGGVAKLKIIRDGKVVTSSMISKDISEEVFVDSFSKIKILCSVPRLKMHEACLDSGQGKLLAFGIKRYPTVKILAEEAVKAANASKTAAPEAVH